MFVVTVRSYAEADTSLRLVARLLLSLRQHASLVAHLARKVLRRCGPSKLGVLLTSTYIWLPRYHNFAGCGRRCDHRGCMSQKMCHCCVTRPYTTAYMHYDTCASCVSWENYSMSGCPIVFLKTKQTLSTAYERLECHLLYSIISWNSKTYLLADS